MPIVVMAWSGVRRRRRSSFQLEEEVVGVAPPPVLARLVGADYGMAGVGPPMRWGVTARGVVPATDVPAGHAHPQVHPAAAGLQALLAAVAGGGDIPDRVEVGASGRVHDWPPTSRAARSQWPSSAAAS